MLVSNLQQFIRSLAQPLTALGISQTAEKSVSGGLTTVADALQPFRDLTTDQLADLLRATREYRETGQLPDWVLAKKPATRRASTPKTPRAPKPTPSEVVAKLRDLQERSHELEPARIGETVQSFSALSVKELQDVQREFLGLVVGKKKEDLLAALQKKINDFRESRERVDGILFR